MFNRRQLMGMMSGALVTPIALLERKAKNNLYIEVNGNKFKCTGFKHLSNIDGLALSFNSDGIGDFEVQHYDIVRLYDNDKFLLAFYMDANYIITNGDYFKFECTIPAENLRQYLSLEKIENEIKNQ